jgi:hypothetical protein
MPIKQFYKMDFMEKQPIYEIYREVIENLPAAALNFISNFDDISDGWEITTHRPGELITFKCDMQNPLKIEIKRFEINQHEPEKTIGKTLINGQLHFDNMAELKQVITFIFRNRFIIG